MPGHHDLAPSTVDAIGNTPLVALDRITEGLPGRILAKLEYLNPGLSKKDRIAREMIEEAEANGELAPGQTVVEMTSGNTGTGLALVCGVKRYPYVAVMSKGNSVERARMMRALGAEVVLIDQLPESTPGQVSGGDIELLEAKTHELVEERNAFRADQFSLAGSYLAHYRHTGPEMIRQSHGTIDAFCDFVGTGGTFAGCAAALKEHNPETPCYVVEPEGCAVLAGEAVTDPNHRIQGGGYAMADLPFLNPAHIDGYCTVSDDEAIAATRMLAAKEGIFAGFSSGANLAAALQLLQGPFPNRTFAILMCDSGLKYLSTDLWE